MFPVVGVEDGELRYIVTRVKQKAVVAEASSAENFDE